MILPIYFSLQLLPLWYTNAHGLLTMAIVIWQSSPR